MDAERARYVDQSMSSSRYLARPSVDAFRDMTMAEWRAGLKTGMYYLRTLAASEHAQIGLDAARGASAAVTSEAIAFRARLRAAREAAERGEECAMCQ